MLFLAFALAQSAPDIESAAERATEAAAGWEASAEEGADASSGTEDTVGVNRFGRSGYDPAKALDDLIEMDLAYEPCVLAAVQKFVKVSDESAAVIADAALGQCSAIEEAWRKAANRVMGDDPTPRIVLLSDDRRTTSRLKAVTLILSLRARPR